MTLEEIRAEARQLAIDAIFLDSPVDAWDLLMGESSIHEENLSKYGFIYHDPKAHPTVHSTRVTLSVISLKSAVLAVKVKNIALKAILADMNKHLPKGGNQ